MLKKDLPALRQRANIVAKGIATLYNPGLSNSVAAKRAARWARRTRYTSQFSLPSIGNLALKSIAFASDTINPPRTHEGPKQTFLQRAKAAKALWGKSTIGFSENYTDPVLRRVRVSNRSYGNLFHELTHALKVSRNHMVSAEALGFYAGTMIERKRPHSEWNFIEKNKDFQVSLRNAFAKMPGLPIIGPGGNAEYKTRKDIRAVVKIGRGSTKVSALVDVGRHLGTYAGNLELSLGKPGAGAFLIRQVSSGVSFANALLAIREGKLDGQIQQWLQKNPILKKSLLGA